MLSSQNRLIWIDLEMTGLDPDSDRIIEIATVITDDHLHVLADGPVFAIRQPQHVMDAMDDWNIRHHGRSGLTERVLRSDCSEHAAEHETLEFLGYWVGKGISPMCGNSICQDRRFLARYMPKLEAYFHYRNLDVSTLKELAKRWAPKVANDVQKQNAHLALADIHDSIAELRHYRDHLLRIEVVDNEGL